MEDLTEQIQQLMRQERSRTEEKSILGKRFLQMNQQFNGYWNEEL